MKTGDSIATFTVVSEKQFQKPYNYRTNYYVIITLEYTGTVTTTQSRVQ